MSLPAAHPEVDPKAGKTCPVTGKTHEYQTPTATDSRSVCPAINTMANHGYIRRDGKKISPLAMFHGLKACYGLSTPLATVLTFGGWFLIKRVGRISLEELGLHGGVEHDASVVHADCAPGERYAPIAIHENLVSDFATHVVQRASDAAGAELSEGDVVVTGHDIVQTRIRRERLSKPLDAVHAEIARGEMAIILGVWEKTLTVGGREETGVPLPWMRTWLGRETLPAGWRPDHVQSLLDVIRRSKAMRTEMKKIRAEEGKDGKAR
ncbi:Chloroperoxidase [Mycena sp. CBHHK59/15]|nr:Chloroperoxidase [Mycena sp. CBHHK59/15]